MRGKTKCSKSSLKSKRLEPRSNDRLCRTLICRQYISESIIPTNKKRVLEMIRGWLSALSGGRNKVFADRLMAIVWKGLY